MRVGPYSGRGRERREIFANSDIVSGQNFKFQTKVKKS